MLHLSEKQMLGRSISILDRYSRIILEQKLKKLNLNYRQMIFMIHLYMKQGIHLEKLARFYKVNRATVSRAVNKLEAEGYVRKVVDSKDAKAYNLYITGKGLSVKEDIMQVFDSWTDIVTDGFTEEEIKTAADLLGRMAEHAAANEKEDLCFY